MHNLAENAAGGLLESLLTVRSGGVLDAPGLVAQGIPKG